MIKVKNIKLLGILLAVLVIFLGVRPLFTQTITNDSIASAIILVLIGIAYIVIVAKPQWAKAEPPLPHPHVRSPIASRTFASCFLF